MRRHLAKAMAFALLFFVVLVFAARLVLNTDFFGASVLRFVSWKSGRSIEVHGALHLHLLSTSPWFEAEQVTIGNPSWTKPGVMATVGRITVRFTPLLSHQSGISLLEIDAAHLQFVRDATGHANWQRVGPDNSPGGPLPMIRALQLTNTHLALVDERLHLVYDGNLSIVGPNSNQPLHIEGAGILNQRAITFKLKGDALPSAVSDKPYAFEFDEDSSGIHLAAHGSLPRPFDLGLVDADLEANGSDLRDLYYLVGVSLPNTGTFRLQGRMMRRVSETLFDELKVVSGDSEVEGHLSLSTQKSGRTLAHADFSSALLRPADIGLRAAGRDPHPDATPKLFSNVQLITPAIRNVDLTGTYRVHRLLLPNVEVDDLSGPFTIDHGLVKAEAIGHILGGNLALSLSADANQAPSRSHIEMTLTGLQLAQTLHKAEPPPYEGLLQLKIHVEGAGDSLHALAANADGYLNAEVLRGTIRASLVELTGVDLRGLGLALANSGRDVAVNCAGADFDIRSGVMHASRLFIDSEPVFIHGEGRVLLDSEMLELKLHGEPKHLRILRVKTPVLVGGTLLQPKFTVDATNSRLRLIDRGTPQDANCAAPPLH